MDRIESLELNIPATAKLRVVIIGGGFGGMKLAEKLSCKDFQLVMFDKHNYHTFQPLLYQVASAGLEPDSIAGPLRQIFASKEDFHFRLLKVTSVNPDANTISTVAGDLAYDYLILANGVKVNYFGNESVKAHSFPLKTIPNALNLRSQLMQMFERANMSNRPDEVDTMLDIVLVGGGPIGVEMAGALVELRKHVLPNDFPELDFTKMSIHLIEGSDRLLAAMSAKAGARALSDLQKMGVNVRLNTMFDSYDGTVARLKSGEEIRTKTLIWSAGVTGDLLAGLKPDMVERGRILTDENCKVKGSPNIYAIGDVAMMKTDKYPKGHPGVAQPAIQMGAYLGKHLKDFHLGKTVAPFKYFNKGDLAAIGRGKAVADLPGNIQFGGRLAWYIWLFIHIAYLVSFRNRLLVFSSWVWNFFTYDKGNRLIIRSFVRDDDPVGKALLQLNETD